MTLSLIACRDTEGEVKIDSRVFVLGILVDVLSVRGEREGMRQNPV